MNEDYLKLTNITRDLEIEYNRLVKERDNIHTTLLNDTIREITQDNIKLKELMEILESKYKNKIDVLSEELETERKRIKSLEEKYLKETDLLIKERDEIRLELDAQEINRDEAEKRKNEELRKKKEETKKIEGELKTKIDHIKKLEAELKTSTNMIKKLEGRIDEIREETESELKIKEREIARLEELNKGVLKQKIDNTKRLEDKRMEDIIKEKEKEIGKLKKELEKLKNSRDEESKIRESDDIIKLSKEKENFLRSELDEKYRNEIIFYEEKLKLEKHEMEEIKNKYEKLKDDYRNLESRLKDQFPFQRKEIDYFKDLKKELFNIKEEREVVKKEYESRINEKMEIIELLKNHLKDREEVIDLQRNLLKNQKLDDWKYDVIMSDNIKKEEPLEVKENFEVVANKQVTNPIVEKINPVITKKREYKRKKVNLEKNKAALNEEVAPLTNKISDAKKPFLPTTKKLKSTINNLINGQNLPESKNEVSTPDNSSFFANLTFTDSSPIIKKPIFKTPKE
ncbi:hypothetical protein TCON_0228 [Astathelohania contejeani]|uniref:Uncharacterized protein n=1 Tax=Astathelohania contejeani TaxID=164912 RepID=A0ABQ7I2B4_9MICR|nr:hypothetical protein TCON_0228 [Thelohania contejeani]